MKCRNRGIRMERAKVGVTASLILRLPGAASPLGNRDNMARPSRTWARYSLPSVVSEKSARPNSRVPSSCSNCLMRWLIALGVTHSSSAACVPERSRANASNVSKHWMGGMRWVTVQPRRCYLKMTVLWPLSSTRCSLCHLTALASTWLSVSRPIAVRSSTVLLWSARATSCSMIGPSSRSAVT